MGQDIEERQYLPPAEPAVGTPSVRALIEDALEVEATASIEDTLELLHPSVVIFDGWVRELLSRVPIASGGTGSLRGWAVLRVRDRDHEGAPSHSEPCKACAAQSSRSQRYLNRLAIHSEYAWSKDGPEEAFVEIGKADGAMELYVDVDEGSIAVTLAELLVLGRQLVAAANDRRAGPLTTNLRFLADDFRL